MKYKQEDMQVSFKIENGVLKKYNGGEYPEIVIPDGVTEIGKHAFYGSGLNAGFRSELAANKVILPDSVKIIGESAFQDCTTLKEINIPSSVTEIKDAAFRGDKFMVVHLPDIESWLNIEATRSGSFMTSWSCSPVSAASAVDFNGQIPETITIPEGHTKIREYAFANLASLKKVIIPGSIREIGNNAFYNCKALEEVIISDGVTKIGSDAFGYCQNLRKIVLPDSVAEIDSGAFHECVSLSEVHLPDNLIEIGSNVFHSCKCLRGLHLPEGLRTLGSNVFENSGIEKLVIPGSVEVLSASLLSECPELREVIIQTGTKEIGRYGFWRDIKLKSITIPDTLKKIGSHSFEGCTQLTEVHISSLKAWLDTEFEGEYSNPCSCDRAYMGFGVDYAKRAEDAYLFIEGKKLEGTVVIPEGINKIGNYAFSGCAGISHIIIPNGVKAIGEYAFSGCKNLKEVTISDGIETIGKCAFAGCKNLKEITVPATIRQIGESAFQSTSLTALCIPSASIEEIGRYFIYGCKYLEYLELHSIPKSMDKDALTNKPSMVLKLPDNTLATKTKLPVTLCSADIAASDEELAWVILFQKAKAWEDWTSKKESKDPDRVFRKMLEICDREAKAPLDVFAEYMGDHLKTIGPDLIRNAITLLEEKKYKDISVLKKSPEVKMILSGKAVKENPIEARVRELCAKHPLSDEALKAVKKGIPYADSKQISSREAVAFILSEYAKEWDRCSGEIIFEKYNTSSNGIKDGTKLSVRPEADEIAEALDRKSLLLVLRELASGIHYRPWLLALARYANDNIVDIWTSNYKTEIKGKAKEYYKAYSMRECLLINDTVAAMRFFDRIGDLERYAKMRGKTAMEMRDSAMLPDFGFDEKGIRSFDTGDSVIEVSITPDLNIRLYDTNAKKEIRSFPKKASDQKKLDMAAAEFNGFKDSVLAFAKSRTELIHKMHISGEYISRDSWRHVYMDHMVVRHLARLLVWQDRKGNTFTVTGNTITNVRGDEYAPEGDIRVAHVLDMQDSEIREWQQALTKDGRKQLFDQVWEPIVKWNKEDIGARYQNAVITYQERNALKKALKQRGIEAGSEAMSFDFNHRAGSYSFSNEGTMQIGSCLRINYHTDPDKKQLTFKKASLRNTDDRREINADLLELDKAVISARISQDNDAALQESALDDFTAAQITSFLNQAIKGKAAKCTAVLLDYKNKRFPEYADINEFSLDW